MSRTHRTLDRTLVAALAAVPALALVAPAVALAPAAPVERAAPAKHVVTFHVRGCEGCEIRVGHADPDYSDVWVSQSKEVTGGRVRFSVPVAYADTLSATVVAPWEGPTGYVTQVVFRYTGHATGERVTVADAAAQRRGSLCLKGDPAAARVSVPIRVARVEVAGQTPSGRTTGALAFASATQPFAKPLTGLVDGVGGGQDLPACG